MGIDSLTNGIQGVVTANPLTSLAGAVVAGTAVGVGTSAIVGAVKRRKTKRRKSKSSRKRSRTTKRRKGMRKRRTPRTAGKRKDRSTKRIRYTKNGQPYVILRNGRARFISKKGAKQSRKRKGGRY